ncbi:transposase [Nocardia sp. NPDC019302]|uniref:transposase n=1 Tax=Nocardia sp. NPDC019302 TaxID=3154592 RepID=UPI0033D99322
MEQARSEGLSLTGADGLLTAVTRRVIEAALEAEMTEHLGYAKGDRAAAAETEGGNHRNGTSRKRMHTDIGQVTVDVPRDRAGGVRATDRAQTRAPCRRVRRGGGQPVCQGAHDR